MDIESIESSFLAISIIALVVIMLFIVYDLAKKSQASKFGTIVLFICLCLGVAGFTFKLLYTFYFKVDFFNI